MRATLSLSLKATSPGEAQELLDDLLSKLRLGGKIDDYTFEIDTSSGVVTEKCILSAGRVVA